MSSALPTQLKIVQSVSEVAASAWNALADAEATPFLEHAWLDALEQSGSAAPESGWHPRHLTLWKGNKLVAAAPAYLKEDSYGEFVFDWSWASAAERLGIHYYPKLIVAVPFSPATGRRFLVAANEDVPAREAELVRGALDYARSEGLSSVHVLFPTSDELERLGALGFSRRFGVQYQWKNANYATYDDFLGRLSSKRRNQLRREARAVRDSGIELSTLRGEALSELDPEAVHALYCSTVDKFAWGRRHLTPDFFQRALKTCQRRIEIVQARKAGKLLAGAFNVAGDEVLYGRYWGCFEEHPFLHFNVCLYHPIEECILQRKRRFEPGAGGEHKLVRGFEPTLTFSAHFIFNPVLERAVSDFLDAERAAVKQGLPQWAMEAGLKPRD